ncbi:DegT/DnrJ/EryC1/StrS family aminotransferase [Lysinibacillus sp. RSDA_15]|uniref:DegT/DnrJ/EryC1/StrS family aminotransferase n=1 Tax=Lysinibacillus sp. RSDA_15 TaxID=3391421 RepID=UPI003A4E6263
MMKKIPPTKVNIPNEDYPVIFEEMKDCLDSGMLTIGKYTKRFESSLSNLLHNKPVVGVSSGTSALEISGMCFDVKDFEVIIPANTFIATPLAFTRIGAKIRFADCDSFFGTITLNEVKRLHNERTKAVVIVHIGGIVAPESLAIKEYCEENNLILIEDAAHAIGSSVDNIQAGTIGDAGTFSFFATKVVTSGEGGAIVLNDNTHLNDCNIYRDQGKKDFSTNLHVLPGSNWRMSEMHAILGYHQLKHLDSFIAARKKTVDHYISRLGSEKLQFVLPPENSISNWYKATALLPEEVNTQKLRENLALKGISLGGEVYKVPCHKQPIYSNEYGEEVLKNTGSFCSQHICLPLSAVMSPDEVDSVCDELIKELKKV